MIIEQLTTAMAGPAAFAFEIAKFKDTPPHT
jgi:hypothetical protein